MRLFLAIQLSPAVREALLTAQDALRRQGRGSFPPPENLHLTLAFLGEAEDPARARAALSEVSCRPFSLAVGGPPGHFGDLWWAGVRADPALEELAVSLQADLRSRGFCQEDRPWLPPHHPGPPLAGRGPAGDRPPRQHGGPADLPPAVRPD